MPRPKKWRKVCFLPESDRFGPLNHPLEQGNFVAMTVDELEALRLIDLEGFTQEDSAERMNVARTTVQRIYNDAREKVADALVNGKVLKIEGGDYRLCDGLGKSCAGRGCYRHRHSGGLKEASRGGIQGPEDP